MQLQVKRISANDDLSSLVSHINTAQWDAANDIGANDYSVASLAAYLRKEDTVFLAGYLTDGTAANLAGIASARIELKPYGFSQWLYVDEIDTVVNFRKRGVGTALMNELIAVAAASGCEEVWLGTENSNDVANAFYESLQPDGIDQVVGYTFELD